MAGVVPCTVSCSGGGSGGGGGTCATSLEAFLLRHTGTGTENVTLGARSVTLTVISGDVDVSIGGGPAVRVSAGWTQTWEGSNCGDNLLSSFAFTGVSGSSDFTIATVRE